MLTFPYTWAHGSAKYRSHVKARKKL